MLLLLIVRVLVAVFIIEIISGYALQTPWVIMRPVLLIHTNTIKGGVASGRF